jgi:hypothetical protein
LASASLQLPRPDFSRITRSYLALGSLRRLPPERAFTPFLQFLLFSFSFSLRAQMLIGHVRQAGPEFDLGKEEAGADRSESATSKGSPATQDDSGGKPIVKKSHALRLEISCPGGADHWAPEIASGRQI